MRKAQPSKPLLLMAGGCRKVADILKYFYEDKDRALSVYMGTQLDFGPHLHGHVEIVGMLKGSSAGFVESRKYEITPGDVFIVFPNQIHYYESRTDENYILLLFPASFADEFVHLLNGRVPDSPLLNNALDDPELFHAFDTAAKLYRPDLNITGMLQLKGYLMIIMGRIFEKLRLSPSDPGELATVNLILNYCMAHYRERLRLEDVAGKLHINKYYISHLFGKKLGMGFGDYVRSLRVGQACRLLEKGGMSIAQVSGAVGFSSTRTFNRAFNRYVGVTPSEYQKKQSNGEIIYPACDKP